MMTLLVVGIATGSIYALGGIAYNIMFSTSKVLSFTTGYFVMLGGVLGAYFIGVAKLPIWLGILFTLISGGILGLITEYVAIRRIVNKTEDHLWMLSTLSLSIIIEQLTAVWWGTEPRPFPDIFGSGYTGLADPKYYAPVGLVLVVLAAVELFYRRTMYGKAFQAVSQDTYAARAKGIPVERVRQMSYVLAGIVACAAGFIAGKLTFAYFEIGTIITLYGFIALAVGGLGSNIGAVLGGWILGIILQTANYFFGGIYQEAIALILLIAILLLRPNGIFGIQGVRRV